MTAKCARMRCDNPNHGVKITADALLEYCIHCAPLVACHRAFLIRTGGR